MHVFGHIHEGRALKKCAWSSDGLDLVVVSEAEHVWDKAAFVDHSADGEGPLKFGEETVFVNAAIMTVQYKPWYVPWVVDLDLASTTDKQALDSRQSSCRNFDCTPGHGTASSHGSDENWMA